jgi:protein-disulfide isomerase
LQHLLEEHRVRRAATVAAVVLVAALAGPRPAHAQEPTNAELKKEIQALAEALRAMQKDLQDIKALVQQARPAQAPQAPQNVVLDLGTNPVQGSATAKLTLVEFTDYQCPFCSRYVRDTYAQILTEYVETGKLRYVLMDLPLESIHKSAFKAAEAAHCAGDQGKYWEMHRRLFENQKTLDAWNAHAEAVGLDVAKFEQCLASGSHAAGIRGDISQAKAAGVAGTPGFFLAVADSTGSKVRTLQSLRGALPFARFKEAIDRLLAEAEKGAVER